MTDTHASQSDIPTSIGRGGSSIPDVWSEFLEALSRHAQTVLARDARLFTTDATDLFARFLAELPAEERPVHTCSACHRFVATYGGLVHVTPEGRTVPLLWDNANVPVFYRRAVSTLATLVRRARVTGVFLSSQRVWGSPQTGEWTHLSLVPPAGVVHTPSVVLSTEQAAAEKAQEFDMLWRGIHDFSRDDVTRAHALLSSGQLYRSEKCEGVAKWLVDLYAARDAVRGTEAKRNVVWRAAATAPVGYCHVRSGMIGTLLEDLHSGTPLDTVKRSFERKMKPDVYMRPSAELSEGNRQQAEKLVAVLRTAGALERRYARLEDVQALWSPVSRAREAHAGGVFGHLRTVAGRHTDVDASAVEMTWEKFARTVLPDAAETTLLVPDFGSFYALVTAKNPDAPPILQWDREEQRNPVSWYTYVNDRPAQHWNLTPGSEVKVTAITLKPSMWNGGGFAHQGQGVIFLLEGAQDKNAGSAGVGLFPEMMRREYHSVRATIEAYSRTAQLEGRDKASACGLGAMAGRSWDVRLRVTTREGVRMRYRLERWD